MPLWGKSDAASNSTIFAPTSVKLAPNSANRDNLFDNTTADAFITGVTVGQFGVDGNEVAANPGISHTGWVLRTVGSGGRAGRVMTEVLVAGGIGTDASDDVAMPDYVLRILTQPVSRSANSTNNDVATFTVAGASTPTGASLSYLWTYANGGSVGAESSNTTSATLSVAANAASNGVSYKVTVSATGAANVVSTNATLTITT